MTTDLFARVQSDHERILGLLERLTGPESATAANRSRALTDLQRLVIEASRHEAAEQQVLWPALHALADRTRAVTAEGLRQEQMTKRRLRRLERAATRAGSPPAAMLAEVAADLRRHIDFEERLVLPALRDVLDEETAAVAGELMARAKARAPTRPHPLTPPVAGLLRASSVVVAPIDKARDLVTRRGRLV